MVAIVCDEYSPFKTTQVKGETQAVGPVYPVPPHWPYSATVPTEEGEDAAALEETLVYKGYAS